MFNLKQYDYIVIKKNGRIQIIDKIEDNKVIAFQVSDMDAVIDYQLGYTPMGWSTYSINEVTVIDEAEVKRRQYSEFTN